MPRWAIGRSLHRSLSSGIAKMATSAVAKGKSIPAHIDYVKVGEGVSKHFGFTRQVLSCITVGVGLGLVFKTWHWNEKRVIAQFYADLAKKEAKEEAARQAAIKAKFAELERELLA